MIMLAVHVARARTNAWTPRVERLVPLEATSIGFRYLLGVRDLDACLAMLQADEDLLDYEVLGESLGPVEVPKEGERAEVF